MSRGCFKTQSRVRMSGGLDEEVWFALILGCAIALYITGYVFFRLRDSDAGVPPIWIVAIPGILVGFVVCVGHIYNYLSDLDESGDDEDQPPAPNSGEAKRGD